MVQLTDIAAEKVRAFMDGQSAESEIGLRVGVRGGGCSGFQYALALDEQRDDDHVFDNSGIRVLVDPASLQYVDGSTVDYTESFQGSGFEVSNPNTVASCGCGSSLRDSSRFDETYHMTTFSPSRMGWPASSVSRVAVRRKWAKAGNMRSASSTVPGISDGSSISSCFCWGSSIR